MYVKVNILENILCRRNSSFNENHISFLSINRAGSDKSFKLGGVSKKGGRFKMDGDKKKEFL